MYFTQEDKEIICQALNRRQTVRTKAREVVTLARQFKTSKDLINKIYYEKQGVRNRKS